MQYLIVVGTPIYRVSEHCFAIESAFGEHLRVLTKKLRIVFDRFVIAAPSLSPEEYERKKATLLHIDEVEEGIFGEPLPIHDGGKLHFWLHDAHRVLPKLSQLVQDSDLLHAGLSMNLWRPFGFIAILLAIARKRKSIFVVDIDFRRSATMNLLTKRWSLGTWLVCKLLYDPLRKLQIAIATRHCSLILLKGKKLVRDFGVHNPRVHDFLDAAHSAAQIATPAVLAHRAATLRDPEHPLELVYFGRLTDYKGVEEMLRALALVRERSALPFRFHIIGDGEDRAHLQGIAEALRIARFVVFHGALPFGPALFDKLKECHLLLATPICEDTPRSALDAFASGLPILAYDTDYYRDLARKSGAVFLSPWNDLRRFSTNLIEINKNRAQLAEKAERAIAFAQANTQEAWLDQRVAWTLQSLSPLPRLRP